MHIFRERARYIQRERAKYERERQREKGGERDIDLKRVGGDIILFSLPEDVKCFQGLYIRCHVTAHFPVVHQLPPLRFSFIKIKLSQLTCKITAIIHSSTLLESNS